MRTPKGLRQLLVLLAVLPLAAYFGHRWILQAQGGQLACNRAQNRCEIDNGWLIRSHDRFPADELRGAKLASSFVGKSKVYSVSVISKTGVHEVGGAAAGNEEARAAAARIDAFAQDPGATSIEVHVSSDAVPYVIVGLMAILYGFAIVAMLIAWQRDRRRRRLAGGAGSELHRADRPLSE